jgi:hypothetical protein
MCAKCYIIPEIALVRRGSCVVYRPLLRNVERRQGVDQAWPD